MYTYQSVSGNAEVHIPMMDHMGNVRHYYQIKTTGSAGPSPATVTGQVTANLDYDAFGREIRATGTKTPATGQPPGLAPGDPWVDALPFHFSTKFTDRESGLNYYGYRFYDAVDGRWLSRDPIAESGGINLYAVCYNSALNSVDDNGLSIVSTGSGLMPTLSNNPRNPIADESENLRYRINKFSPSDNARLFLITQKAILDKLADGRCCLTRAQMDWLEKLISDFMKPLIDSLDGNVPSGSGWDNNLNKEVDRSNRTNNRDADVIDDPFRGGLRRLREITDARQMALVHIGEDLRNSLRKNGVGEDSVWACVGQAVAEAEAENFSSMERRMSKMAGKGLGSTYDMSRFRDDMRDEVKAEGVPRYPNASDPTSLIP
jgi:RHS repeat-associated protein